MLGRNPTNLAVYIKIKRAAELCWLMQGDWLMKASSVWCAVGKRVEGWVHYIPITLSPLMAKGEEGIRERPPLADSKPKDVCSAGLRKASECVWCKSTQYCNPKATHTHDTQNTKQRFGRSFQRTHAAPTRTLGLKVLFISVTDCGSGVILLQYWVTITTLMPSFKFNSEPSFCYLAPQMGAPAFMRQQQRC